jgi:hypothetical protein
LGWYACSGGSELSAGGLGAIRLKSSLVAAAKTRSTTGVVLSLGVLCSYLRKYLLFLTIIFVLYSLFESCDRLKLETRAISTIFLYFPGSGITDISERM